MNFAAFAHIPLTFADALRDGTKRVHLSGSNAERTDDNAGDHGGQEVEMPPLKVLAIALALAAASPAAHADKAPAPPAPFAKCKIHRDAKFYTRFRDLPEAIRLDFVKHRGAIAEWGEHYNGSDVFLPDDAEYNAIPRLQFVGAVELDEIWVIWGQGMRGVRFFVAYRFEARSTSSREPEPPLDIGVTLSAPEGCPVVEAFLSGMVVPGWRPETPETTEP